MKNIPRTSSAAPAASPSPSSPSTAHTELGMRVPPPHPAEAPSQLQALTLRERSAIEASSAMAPRASLPLVQQDIAERGETAEASPISVASAKQTMARLLKELESARDAIPRGGSCKGYEGVIDAADAVFRHYSRLPRDVAIRTFSDSRVREMCDRVLVADNLLNQLRKLECVAVDAEKAKLQKVLFGLIEVNAQRRKSDRINLGRLFVDLCKNNMATVQLWDDIAERQEQVLSMLQRVAHVAAATAQRRREDEETLRQKTAHVALSRFMVMQSMVEFAIVNIKGRTERGDPMRNALDDTVQLLGTLSKDIIPAFRSAISMTVTGGSLDDATREVLDGIVDRLQEFASGVENAGGRLNEAPAGTEVPSELVELLDLIYESVWVTANDVRRTLDAHVRGAPGEAVPQSAKKSVAIDDAQAAAPAQGSTKGRSKGKGKVKAISAAAESIAPAEPVSAATASASSSACSVSVEPNKVLGRSALGTKLIVDAAPSVTSVSMSPSGEKPLQWLARLLAFDLSAEQRDAARARRERSPENASYLVEEAIKRLEAQADEMQTCVSELSRPRLRRQLQGTQLNEVHQQTGRLRDLSAQVKGVARSLKDGMAVTTIEHMKTYAFPTQAHIEQLLQAGELAPVGPPSALKSEPCTLFEIKLQPAALRNETMPRPMWLHLHTRQAVLARQLHELRDADFAACHLKSDVEHGRNREWQDARAREGHENVMIYRGKVEPALCRSLMTS